MRVRTALVLTIDCVSSVCACNGSRMYLAAAAMHLLAMQCLCGGRHSTIGQCTHWLTTSAVDASTHRHCSSPSPIIMPNVAEWTFVRHERA